MYERSITKNLSVNFDCHQFNLLEYAILPSKVFPEGSAVAPFTYPWILEERSRRAINKFLISNSLTEMTQPTLGFVELKMPTLNISKPELLKRVEKFKKDAFSLMYRLADCTAGLEYPHHIRAQQSEFFQKVLTASELAKLGCMVRIFGMGHFLISQNKGIRDDDYVRESTCIFEDRVLRFGPHFAWAYLTEYRNSSRWAKKEMQIGLDNMEAFESGQFMAYASLQSVVWHCFCKKANCSLYDSWDTAKGIVELEMASYKLE
jgi:hypothetical protein